MPQSHFSKEFNALPPTKVIMRTFLVYASHQRSRSSLLLSVRITHLKFGTSLKTKMEQPKLWTPPRWQSWHIRNTSMQSEWLPMISLLQLLRKTRPSTSGRPALWLSKWPLKVTRVEFGISNSHQLNSFWFLHQATNCVKCGILALVNALQLCKATPKH